MESSLSRWYKRRYQWSGVWRYEIATSCTILSALRIPPRMASLVFLVRKMPSHTSTLPRPKAVTYQFTNEHLCIFSTLESGLIAGYDIPPHVQVQVHMLLTPAETSLMVKCSHGRPPGSARRPDFVGSFPDCPGRDL